MHDTGLNTVKLIHTATPARHDKTVLSVSRSLELDSRQLKTVADRKLEVCTRSDQSPNSHRHVRHDTDRTVFRVWCGGGN